MKKEIENIINRLQAVETSIQTKLTAALPVETRDLWEERLNCAQDAISALRTMFA